jgi:hypothetical protein
MANKDYPDPIKNVPFGNAHRRERIDMSSTVIKILAAIGTILLSMAGMWVVNWVNRVDAAVDKVLVIEALLPTMNAAVGVVKDDVKDIKGDVKALREDVAKIRGKQ